MFLGRQCGGVRKAQLALEGGRRCSSPASAIYSCVALGKLPNLSALRFPYSMRMISLSELLHMLTKSVCTKHLEGQRVSVKR